MTNQVVILSEKDKCLRGFKEYVGHPSVDYDEDTNVYTDTYTGRRYRVLYDITTLSIPNISITELPLGESHDTK